MIDTNAIKRWARHQVHFPNSVDGMDTDNGVNYEYDNGPFLEKRIDGQGGYMVAVFQCSYERARHMEVNIPDHVVRSNMSR